MLFSVCHIPSFLKVPWICRAVNLPRLQIWRIWLPSQQQQSALQGRGIMPKFTASVEGGGGGVFLYKTLFQTTLTISDVIFGKLSLWQIANVANYPADYRHKYGDRKLRFKIGRLQSDINLDTGRYDSISGVSRIIRESWQPWIWRTHSRSGVVKPCPVGRHINYWVHLYTCKGETPWKVMHNHGQYLMAVSHNCSHNYFVETFYWDHRYM